MLSIAGMSIRHGKGVLKVGLGEMPAIPRQGALMFACTARQDSIACRSTTRSLYPSHAFDERRVSSAVHQETRDAGEEILLIKTPFGNGPKANWTEQVRKSFMVSPDKRSRVEAL